MATVIQPIRENVEVSDLGVDPMTFDSAQAITMAQASKLMRGRRGRPLSVHVARRWASPRRGCVIRRRAAFGQPARVVKLVLPTVKLGGELLTMAPWVEAFERARSRIAVANGEARKREDAPAVRTPKQRERANTNARAILAAEGIGCNRS